MVNGLISPNDHPVFNFFIGNNPHLDLLFFAFYEVMDELKKLDGLTAV